MGVKGLKPNWISIDELHKIDPDSVNWEELEKAIKELRNKSCEPHISIWYDKIGTDIHFDDGSMSCRDFGGDDSKHFVTLMIAISEHKWKEAVTILEEHFING